MNGEDSFAQQVHLQIRRMKPAFFQNPSGNKSFLWGEEQQKAFKDLKTYLEHITKLTSPTPKAELLLYIAATPFAVSAILVEEKPQQGRVSQHPVYYVSEALNGSKVYYSEMEKMAYAVVMASRKLKYYFQSHNITVPTSHPLRDMFDNRESISCIGKWAAKLAEYVINFTA